MMSKLFLFLFLSLFAKVQAAELYQPGLPSRCLAMGGACVSQVKGAQALFLNPAALAKVQGFDFIIAQVKAGISKDTLDFSSQFSGGSTFQATDLNNLYGKTIMADIDARSGFVMPNFGFGVYSNNYTKMQFSDPTFPTFNMNLISDYGYVIGGSMLLDNSSSVGATFRHVKRWGGNQDINVASLTGASANDLANNNFQNYGTGHAIDLAYMKVFNGSLKPALSIVWRDIGVTQFNKTSGVADPPRQTDNLILGLSLEQEISFMNLYHGIEYSHITDYAEEPTKKLHFGSELSIGPLDLRAGFNQGYLTYGVGLDLWFFELEATSYATEMGTYAGQLKSDRYNISLTIEMDFDQSFKLLDSKGKKRRLMQRR